MSKIWISGISHYVPEQVVTNSEMIERFNIRMKPAWVEKVIGIKERRWANANEAASDLAVSAAKQLDLEGFCGPIYLSTISGDFPTPSTSSIVKRKLGISGRSSATDVNAACAGQIFALELGYNKLMTSSVDSEVLVIASEVRSKFLNTQDRRTVFLFSDAACAIKLERSDNPPGEIEWIVTQTVGSDEYEILIPGGGSAAPLTNESFASGGHLITMVDGSKIFEKTTVELINEIENTLKNKGMSKSDYDHFIFHQGNGNLIRVICQRLGIPLEKAWINFETFGNSSSASAGVSLSHAYNKGVIKKGDRVLMMAMGAGYHLGLVSIRWGI